MALTSISVMGAGNVGGACAAAIAARRLGSIRLYDIVEDLAIGKAMDINHASPFFGSDSRVRGCNRTEELAGSDIVIITAGAPRRQGMARSDLLVENLGVLDSLVAGVAEHSPSARVLIVTNPVEALTWYVRKRWPELNIFGLGCSLDTLRFRFFLAEEAHVSVDCVSAMVIGTHDDCMIPMVNHATIGGVDVNHLLTAEQIDIVIRRTREAGTSIVRRLKDRGSFYAASHTVAGIVEAMVQHTHGIFPVSVAPSAHYGGDGLVLNLPSVVGAGGVERIVDIDMDQEERAALDRCRESVGKAIDSIRDY